MRLSSTNSPAKLWGRYEADLSAGDYFIHIKISFDPSVFEGGKNFIISGNTGIFSSTNFMLASCLIALGILIFSFSIFLLVLKLRYQKEKRKEL